MRSRSEAAVISRPPSLPMASTATCAARHAPVRALELAPRRSARAPRSASRRGRDRPRPPAAPIACRRARARRSGMPAPAEDARAVERILIVARLRRSRSRPARSSSVGRRHACRRSPDRAPHRAGAARRPRMRASRGAVPMMSAISRSRLGLARKQREELHARRQLGEEPVEGGERAIGLGGLGQAPRAAPARTRSAARAPAALRIAG